MVKSTIELLLPDHFRLLLGVLGGYRYLAVVDAEEHPVGTLLLLVGSFVELLDGLTLYLRVTCCNRLSFCIFITLFMPL
jgi:hypothetical protein